MQTHNLQKKQDIWFESITYFLQIFQFFMGCHLILCQKDTIPWGPLLVFIPTTQDQVIEVIPGAQWTLTWPNVLNKVAKVILL